LNSSNVGFELQLNIDFDSFVAYTSGYSDFLFNISSTLFKKISSVSINWIASNGNTTIINGSVEVDDNNTAKNLSAYLINQIINNPYLLDYDIFAYNVAPFYNDIRLNSTTSFFSSSDWNNRALEIAFLVFIPLIVLGFIVASAFFLYKYKKTKDLLKNSKKKPENIQNN
jgi:hypothetical protein